MEYFMERALWKYHIYFKLHIIVEYIEKYVPFCLYKDGYLNNQKLHLYILLSLTVNASRTM